PHLVVVQEGVNSLACPGAVGSRRSPRHRLSRIGRGTGDRGKVRHADLLHRVAARDEDRKRGRLAFGLQTAIHYLDSEWFDVEDPFETDYLVDAGWSSHKREVGCAGNDARHARGRAEQSVFKGNLGMILAEVLLPRRHRATHPAITPGADCAARDRYR